LIKLHRKDRAEHYQQSLRSGIANKRLFVVPDGTAGLPTNIFDWLQGCTMVLTGASSVGIEAMVMEVPVVTMDFMKEIRNADFIDAGATMHVETYEQLEAAVRSILTAGPPDELRRQAQAFVKDAFFALDGRSAERGARAVAELANRKALALGTAKAP
jgi:UDP-N-acetylglucosamine 2-epimerase